MPVHEIALSIVLACQAEVPVMTRVAALLYVAFLAVGTVGFLFSGRFHQMAIFMTTTIAAGLLLFGLVFPAAT